MPILAVLILVAVFVAAGVVCAAYLEDEFF